jgi:hypothetical protein
VANTNYPADHLLWWQIVAHGVAFCAAFAIGAIIFYPYYPIFREETDTAGEAFGAFLTCCVIIGGMGPMITLMFFWMLRLATRRRSAASFSRQHRIGSQVQ